MTQPIERDPIYRGRRFQAETMMADRGIIVSHTTIMLWVLRYVPVQQAHLGAALHVLVRGSGVAITRESH
jgi:hypothetical protein